MNWARLRRIAALTLMQLCAVGAAMSQPSKGDVEVLCRQVVSGSEIQRDAAFQRLVELLPESRQGLIAALDDHWNAYFGRFSQLALFKELGRLHGLRRELLHSRQVALSMLLTGRKGNETDSPLANETDKIRAVERLLRLWESRERVSLANGVPNALFSQLKWNQAARLRHDCPLQPNVRDGAPAWLLLVHPEDRVFTVQNVPAHFEDEQAIEAHRKFVADMRVPDGCTPGPYPYEPMSSEKDALIAMAEVRAIFGLAPHKWNAELHRAVWEVCGRSSRDAEHALLRLEGNDPVLERELMEQAGFVGSRPTGSNAPAASAFPLDSWPRKGSLGDTARWICTHFRKRSAAFDATALASCAVWTSSGVWIVTVR